METMIRAATDNPKAVAVLLTWATIAELLRLAAG